MPRDADEPLDDDRYRTEDDAERARRRDREDRPELDDDVDDEDLERRRRRRRRRRRDDDYPEQDIGQDAGMRMLLPVGRSGWAIASGYLGLISVICVPAPFALLTGILALNEMKKNPKLHGMGRAIFGIIMGSIGSVLLILMMIALVVESMKGR